MAAPVLRSIQVGRPQNFGTEGASDPMDRPWTTGFFKEPVVGAVRINRFHLEGDGQADLINHGGLDKAVCVYPADHYPYWRRELNIPLPFGAFGENFTVEGLTEELVCIGDVWTVDGAATFQVTQPRQPCWKMARRWRIKTLALQVQQAGKTGWYFRVLGEGVVAPDSPMSLLQRPHPDWTVARANRIMHRDKNNLREAAELCALPPLSESWRETLTRRL